MEQKRGRRGGEAAFFLHPSFLLPLLAAIVIGFGYSILHPAVGVDDLCRSRYVAGGWYLCVKRPGAWLVMWISEKLGIAQTGAAVLMALFMAVSAVVLCMLLRREARDRLPRICYTVFACLFVSCPIAAENFVFADTGVWVALGYGVLGAALMLCAPSEGGISKRLWRLIAASVLCALAVSMFQSLATAFICLAGAMLTLNCIFEKNVRFSRILTRGLTMAGVLCAAVLMVEIVSRVCINALELPPFYINSQEITWFNGKMAIGKRLEYLVLDFVRKILIPSLYYEPFTALLGAYLLSLIGCVYALIKRRASAILPIAVMALSTVLMPLVQGQFVGYRLCQSFAVYTAFAGMLLTAWAYAGGRRKKAGIMVGAACLSLALMQCVLLDGLFRVDDTRYQEEKQVAETIITELTREADECNKPVAFVGKYAVNEDIRRAGLINTQFPLYNKLYKRFTFVYDEQRCIDFTKESLLGWAVTSFHDNGTEMVRLCRYLGYEDVSGVSGAQYIEAQIIAADMPAYPEDGYIADAGDYRIVKLGPLEQAEE